VIEHPVAVDTETGVVAVVGSPNSGRPAATLALLNRASSLSGTVGFLGLDPGQFEASLPGTVVAALASAPVGNLGELRTLETVFAGDVVAPLRGGIGPLAAQRLLQPIRAAGGRLTIAECVWVGTAGGRDVRLPDELLALRPTEVLWVGSGAAPAPLAVWSELLTGSPLRSLGYDATAARSESYLRLMRAGRLHRHLEHARVHDLDLSEICMIDSWLGWGEALRTRELRDASQALEQPVVYGERLDDQIWLCSERGVPRDSSRKLEELFGEKKVGVTPIGLFQGLYVGLMGPGARLLDVGVLRGINFERAVISVITPLRSVADVSAIRLGRVRLSGDGTVLQRLRPGDL